MPPEHVASVPPKKRWIAWVAGAAVLVTVVLILANRDQAPEVQIAQVNRENLSASITSNGRVEPVQPFLAVAKYFTEVDRVDATEGQAVRKGQVILVLDSYAPQQQLDKARADLLTAQTTPRCTHRGPSRASGADRG